LDRESLEQIVSIEVKSSVKTAFTKRERLIRDAIQAGRVQWREIRLDPSRIASAPAAAELAPASIHDPTRRSGIWPFRK
jgi:hypothetical protein